MVQTALCNTVIDDPHHTDKDTTINDLLQYLTSDTIMYVSPPPSQQAREPL